MWSSTGSYAHANTVSSPVGTASDKGSFKHTAETQGYHFHILGLHVVSSFFLDLMREVGFGLGLENWNFPEVFYA